jgi:sigma-B regulation protein RsbU (phosphoserine phosphatase)
VTDRRRMRLLPYGIALLSCTAATLLTLLLGPLIGTSALLLFLAAVAISAWYGGLGPGLLATAFNALASKYLLLPPRHSLEITRPDVAVRLALFVLIALLVSSLEERLRARERQAEEAQQNLTTLLQHEQSVLGTLTESFLPKTPNFPDIQMASLYRPAAEAEQVGGDFVDFIPLDGRRLGVVIGDVCGHGLAAALYTTTARYMLRAYAWESPEPRQVLHRLNQALCHEMDEEGRYITLIYGVLDRASVDFTYADAGHPPPVIYDPTSDRCRRLCVTGGMVGAFPDMKYEQLTVTLAPGSVLALFTDGVTEAAGRHDPREDESLFAVVRPHARESADAIAQALFARARQKAGGEQRDDIAIVVIRRSIRA